MVELRLIGLKDFGLSSTNLPAFGINIALKVSQADGMGLIRPVSHPPLYFAVRPYFVNILIYNAGRGLFLPN